jgi:hypothetical protein
MARAYASETFGLAPNSHLERKCITMTVMVGISGRTTLLLVNNSHGHCLLETGWVEHRQSTIV